MTLYSSGSQPFFMATQVIETKQFTESCDPKVMQQRSQNYIANLMQQFSLA